ncbi:MAG: ATP-binding protein, partial [Acetobacteraceae bacterium]|nr:ATP-binding protein [Acetobacteraceae bacterium]
LFNLVGNALKFTSAGEVSVRVQRGADLPDDRFLLMFDVEDTGIGIPPDVVPTLFCHFTQADSSITRIYGGTGLGLAICKRLCTLLGGSIMVVSTPGKGSLFQFTISAATGEASMPAPPPTGAPSLPPLRILVVDDNSVNLQVVDGLLSRPGHRVTAVSSGQAAIDLLKASQPGLFDVVLMDVQMPEMDGLTATRVIRALPPPAGTVPVIALTAHGSTGSRSLCLAAGMNGFIIKPAGLQRMEHEIAAVLHLEPMQAPAGPTSPAPEALLDAAQIAELAAALDPEAWEQVTASLQQTAMTEIPRIIAAINAGQSPAQPAHTLKGAAWNTGALRLGNLARRLETAPPAEARQIAGELPQVLQETVAALTAQVSSKLEA